MNELIDTFVNNGVYIHKCVPKCIFVCIECYEDAIGKLIVYNKNGNMWEKSCISYFLNHYYADDMKELFLDRKNYDMIGMIGNNFEFSKDEENMYVLRK